ncbi:MAG: ATP-binding cassette domain-containing protein, partial [Pseudomonadota bacterium]
MSEALRLEGIEKGYYLGKPNEIRVLGGVDLTVASGEVCALVAPSGAGKSTLLHIAGLLDTPDRGRVIVSGDDLTGQGDRARTRARRKRIGFIYQFHHLLPEFSATENIVLPQLADGV